MIGLSLGEAAALCDGQLAGGADPATPVTSVVSDSRDASPGALFVAIAGDKVDGHDFAAAAVAAGACGVLAARPLPQPCIVADDPVRALGRLASGALGRMPDVTVVGITGSSGKTSTKDLIAQVVDPPVVSPLGSYNTEVGLPLTVLRADESTRVLVLEMGMRGMGHIRTLTQIARPDIAVVTNVGSAHLELLGSRDNIALAKGEIVEGVNPDGIAVLNADDHRVLAMRSRTSARIVTYGTAEGADVRAEQIALDGQACASFVITHGAERGYVTLAMHGAHMVHNALAAAAVGLATGVDLETITRRLAEARPLSRWRMEVRRRADGVTIINDAYNANPESTRAGLDALAGMASGRTIAVLGEMREIGETTVAEHRGVGEYAALLGIGTVVAVGAGAAPIADGAVAAGHRATHAVDTVEDALEVLNGQLAPGDVVLVKASRSVGLDRVAAALLGEADA